MTVNFIPFTTVFSLVVQLFWLIVLFFVFNFIAVRLIKREKIRKKFIFYIPLFRDIALILFGIRTLFILGNYNPLLVLAIAGVLVALTWSVLKDFVMGIIFKILRGNLIGQQLKIDEYKGRIIRMGEIKISIELKNGEIVQFPYSRLFSDTIVKPISNQKVKIQTLFLPFNNRGAFSKVQDKLKKKILSNPWVVSDNDVIVELFNEQDSDELKIKVSYSIDASSNEAEIKNNITRYITQ